MEEDDQSAGRGQIILKQEQRGVRSLREGNNVNFLIHKPHS